jgi:hypothetical protein
MVDFIMVRVREEHITFRLQTMYIYSSKIMIFYLSGLLLNGNKQKIQFLKLFDDQVYWATKIAIVEHNIIT